MREVHYMYIYVLEQSIAKVCFNKCNRTASVICNSVKSGDIISIACDFINKRFLSMLQKIIHIYIAYFYRKKYLDLFIKLCKINTVTALDEI